MFKLLVFVAICVSCIETTFGHGSLCPCGWEKILNGCYLFVRNKVTWDTARADCMKRGGDLVIPINTLQCVLLSQRASQHGMGIPWIGVFRRFDGVFYDTCGKTLRFSRWDPGEPNGGNSENCAHMYAGRGLWNDVPCRRTYGYICQFKTHRCD